MQFLSTFLAKNQTNHFIWPAVLLSWTDIRSASNCQYGHAVRFVMLLLVSGPTAFIFDKVALFLIDRHFSLFLHILPPPLPCAGHTFRPHRMSTWKRKEQEHMFCPTQPLLILPKYSCKVLFGRTHTNRLGMQTGTLFFTIVERKNLHMYDLYSHMDESWEKVVAFCSATLRTHIQCLNMHI